jgi:hypothetical protein
MEGSERGDEGVEGKGEGDLTKKCHKKVPDRFLNFPILLRWICFES